MTKGLAKSLGVMGGTTLMLNIVIGAGLLTLPGLAVEQAKGYAFAAWLACAVCAVPLLGVFIVLGKRYPEAGGISAYARRAFGPLGERIASLLFLGAVIFGLPAISLTGGHYVAAVFGGSPRLYAALLIVCAMVPHLLPGTAAARAMSWLASLVVGAIVAFLVVGIVSAFDRPIHLPILFPPLSHIAVLASPFMMLFFAFTGWEVGAGIAEEFRNPARDYPIAMGLSFLIATVLYLGIAYVAQDIDISGSYISPFVAITRPSLGNGGVSLVACVAAVIIFANLSGAVWGVSRMVYGLGRDGVLPSALGQASAGRPVAAVAATIGTLLVVLLLGGLGIIGIGQMFSLAGQNFLILYGIASLVILKMSNSLIEKYLCLFVLAGSGVILFTQGKSILYPMILMLFSYLLTIVQRQQATVMSTEHQEN
jgi:amino acid efflux transporter